MALWSAIDDGVMPRASLAAYSNFDLLSADFPAFLLFLFRFAPSLGL